MRVRNRLGCKIWWLCAIVAAWIVLTLPSPVQASTAYGSLNNFDAVNDTGVEAHGFDIELDDVHSKDITYTYDYNHYGVPKITEDNSDPAHPKVRIRYAAIRKPDGTWSAFTAIPAGPITPTDGHQFTNPSVNFGGEHFGAGFYGVPTAVRYFWLIDDGTGNLVHGPPVNIATPTFTYFPPAPAQVPQVQAVIVPPPPPAPPPLQFGDPTWVNDIKTTTHNPNKVELADLVDPDPHDPTAKNWQNGEPAEVESEWRIFQTEFANADNPKGKVEGVPEDLPEGNEVITRRYEFYKYIGPRDAETGEAMADQVAADGKHGVGTVTYADHFDPVTGEWVTVTVDLSTVEVVGDFIGAQMSGFDVAPALGLIDHIPDGELNVPYAERMVVISGGAPFLVTVTGLPPDGTNLDEVTGIFSGTPTAAGVFTFTVDASDITGASVTKTYTVTIPEGAPATSTITTSASPAEGGTTNGDGVYDNGTHLTVIANHNPGFAFVNWTENDLEVSTDNVYPFTVNANRTLVAHFIIVNVPPTAVNGTLTTDEDTPAHGTLHASDNNGDALTFSIVTNGTKGTAVITNAATGAYTYTPNPNANGSDSFTFKANDGKLDSIPATVVVTINPVNDAPVAQNGTLNTNIDTPANGTLHATDIDSTGFIYAIVANGTRGTAIITDVTTGDYTYTPNPGASGIDTFTFTANDDTAVSNIATVTVTIASARQGVTVKLLNSQGIGLAGGVVSFYNNGWQPFGFTGVDGTVSLVLAPGPYSFRMVYNGGTIVKGQYITGDAEVVFRTIPVTVELRNSAGALIDPGQAQFYDGAASIWHKLGDTVGGQVQTEMLPTSIFFAMTTVNARLQKTQHVGNNPVVVFQLSPVMVKLLDSQGKGITGGVVSYYLGGWRPFGTTVADGTVTGDLARGAYAFRVVYAGGSSYQSRNIRGGEEIIFRTTRVTVELRSSDGALPDAGAVEYYAGAALGWVALGNTVGGQIQVELLPGSYPFAVTYAYLRAQMTQNIGVNPDVIFRTGQVHSASNTCKSYYAGGWRAFTQDMQLLAGDILFRFTTGTPIQQPYPIAGGTMNTIR